MQQPYAGGVRAVAISADGRIGLVATFKVGKENTHFGNVKEAGILRFWDLTTGKALFPMQQPYAGGVRAVAISADGRRGLSGGRNGELTLWDLTTGQRVRSLGPQPGEVFPHAIAFFPDGRRAATGGSDGSVHIWDLDNGNEQAAWPGVGGSTRGLAISADGRRLVAGSYEGAVILWDADRGAIVHRFDMPANDRAVHVAFDPDGHIVTAGTGVTGPPSRPGNLLVWDAQTYALLRRDERPFARHRAVATLPGGRVLTADDYAIRLWTPRSTAGVASASTAVASGRSAPVDLLAQIGREPHKQYGQWQVTDGALLSPATAWARLQVPYDPPPDYRIDMKIELAGKLADTPFGLGLMLGGAQTEIVIDKLLAKDGRQSPSLETNGRYSGLNGVDGVPVPFGPNVHHGRLLLASRPIQLVATVHPTSVRLTCDGALVVDWHGDPRQLIRHAGWNSVGARSLFLYSSSPVRIHQMTLTPVSATPR
jgi:WD40 repeat protein